MRGRFSMPMGIALDRRRGHDETLFVCDSLNHRAQVFSLSPFEVKFIIAFGEEGEGEGQFHEPVSVCVDTIGRIFVVDSSFRVQVFIFPEVHRPFVNCDCMKSEPSVILRRFAGHQRAGGRGGAVFEQGHSGHRRWLPAVTSIRFLLTLQHAIWIQSLLRLGCMITCTFGPAFAFWACAWPFFFFF